MTGEPRAVIVGTGRHGSGYVARVLTAAGVPCGHEQWWNPHHARLRGLAVDSSWCAVPFLRWYGGAVWHQTRHPLDVISSLVKLPNWGQYLTLVETVAGPLPGEVVAAARRVRGRPRHHVPPPREGGVMGEKLNAGHAKARALALRAKVLGVDKPKPVPEGQLDIFGDAA